MTLWCINLCSSHQTFFMYKLMLITSQILHVCLDWWWFWRNRSGNIKLQSLAFSKIIVILTISPPIQIRLRSLLASYTNSNKIIKKKTKSIAMIEATVWTHCHPSYSIKWQTKETLNNGRVFYLFLNQIPEGVFVIFVARQVFPMD
jgi:hypothetical protein